MRGQGSGSGSGPGSGSGSGPGSAYLPRELQAVIAPAHALRVVLRRARLAAGRQRILGMCVALHLESVQRAEGLRTVLAELASLLGVRVGVGGRGYG